MPVKGHFKKQHVAKSYNNLIAGSDNAEQAKEVLKAKEIKGVNVVVGAQNQLMLDYDTDEFPQKRFNEGIDFLRQRLKDSPGSICYSRYRSKSGRHWHVIINCPFNFYSEVERVAWQLVFGSDFKKEAMSLIAISRDIKNPILLYMKDGIQPESEGGIAIDAPFDLQLKGRKFKDVK